MCSNYLMVEHLNLKWDVGDNEDIGSKEEGKITHSAHKCAASEEPTDILSTALEERKS